MIKLSTENTAKLEDIEQAIEHRRKNLQKVLENGAARVLFGLEEVEITGMDNEEKNIEKQLGWVKRGAAGSPDAG